MKNLYKVYTSKFTFLVLAKKYSEASKITEEYLEKEDYGYSHQRGVVKIELIGEPSAYPSVNSTFKDNVMTLLPVEDE
jgi:hypothetical protein